MSAEVRAEHPWVTRCRRGGGPLRVIAHRGGAGLNPENTLAAFDAALELGVDGLELDVRLSRDGHPVVIHDADLDRTTDATGPVARLTAAELAEVDAGYRFAPERGHPWRGKGLGISTLAAVLERVPQLPIIVELKGEDPELARAAVGVVAGAGALDRVCFGGFADLTLRAARDAAPACCTGAARDEIRRALYKSYVGWPLGRVSYAAFQVPERSQRTTIVTPRFVRYAQRAGRLVQVWTVNAEADMRRLAGWAVDAVITDRPDVAVRVCRGLR
jgi:glycerophosphoryl diester phosphodiesterase